MRTWKAVYVHFFIRLILGIKQGKNIQTVLIINFASTKNKIMVIFTIDFSFCFTLEYSPTVASFIAKVCAFHKTIRLEIFLQLSVPFCFRTFVCWTVILNWVLVSKLFNEVGEIRLKRFHLLNSHILIIRQWIFEFGKFSNWTISLMCHTKRSRGLTCTTTPQIEATRSDGC